MVEPFLAETFVGIDEHCLLGELSGIPSPHAHFTELVKNALCPNTLKIFHIDGPPPIMMFIAVARIVKEEDAKQRMIKIIWVCRYRDNRQGELTREQNV